MADKKIKLPNIKLPKFNKKKDIVNHKVKIQTLEEYIIDYNVPIPKPDISRFPDLFGIKLEKQKRDDISSKTPVLEGTAAINLYAALLVAKAEIEKKQREEQNKKETE